MWNLSKLIATWSKLVVARGGGWRVGLMGKGSQRYKLKSWGINKYSMVTIVHEALLYI